MYRHFIHAKRSYHGTAALCTVQITKLQSMAITNRSAQISSLYVNLQHIEHGRTNYRFFSYIPWMRILIAVQTMRMVEVITGRYCISTALYGVETNLVHGQNDARRLLSISSTSAVYFSNRVLQIDTERRHWSGAKKKGGQANLTTLLTYSDNENRFLIDVMADHKNGSVQVGEEIALRICALRKPFLASLFTSSAIN